MFGRDIRAAWPLLFLFSTLASGCGAEQGGGNRSPRSTDDPAAYERAASEAKEVEAAAREAEAAAFGKISLDDLADS